MTPGPHGANGPLSSLHSAPRPSLTVNENVADRELLGLLGACAMVTVGGVPSTTTVGWEPLRANSSVSLAKR